MLPADRDRLSQPISVGDPRDPDHQFQSALGLDLPSWRALIRNLASDNSRTHAGIRWWTDVDDDRRRLITFQLVEAVSTIPSLLVRARLHLLELAEQVEANNRDPHCAVLERGADEMQVLHMRRETAAAHLPPEMLALHVAGTVHSLFSAIDVLGAVIVGVTALPTDIVGASFSRSLNVLRNPPRGTSDSLRGQWAQLHAVLERDLRSAGPAGWWSWLRAARHTAAHRPRIPISEFIQQNGSYAQIDRETFLHGVRLEPRLPRNPARAFVQALATDGHTTYVAESAVQTLQGVCDAVSAFVELTATALADFWVGRREGRLPRLQPLEQWETLEIAAEEDFVGVAPGPDPTGNLQMTLSESAFGNLVNSTPPAEHK